MNIHYFLNTAPIGKDNKANPNLPITEDANFPNLNGATSRFAATYPGEHIKNQGNNVSYYYIGKETSTENLRKIANQISKNDICFFIKNQDINCQKMMQLAKEKGAKCGVHVPDP
ncbi:MAG: hypothetical protein JW812_00665, partial [Alphaproteobacteria bacterium]|nr:hypothetical protein [Alphaproteobacteria bacterium]